VGQGERGRDFLDFLDRNQGRKVFIDVWLSSTEFPQVEPEGDWLATRWFTIRDESPRQLLPNQSVRIAVDDPRESQFTYASGAWKLHGYFAVRGVVAARQDTVERVLEPIPLKEAVN
jgi:hypothetical protein